MKITQEQLDYFCGVPEKVALRMASIGKPFPMMSALEEILSLHAYMLKGGTFWTEGDYCE